MVRPASSGAAQQRNHDRHHQPQLQPAKQCAQFFVATLERFFVETRNAVGDLKHRRTPWNQFFVEEGEAFLVAFFRRPGERTVQNFPVRINLRSQCAERARVLPVRGLASIFPALLRFRA